MLTIDGDKAAQLKAAAAAAATAEKQQAIYAEVDEKASVCVAPDGEVPVTEAEAQFGRALPSFMVIEKLRKLNGLLVFEQAKQDPNIIGIYIIDGLSQYKGMRFLCGMEREENPEFSIRKFQKVPYFDEESQSVKDRLEFIGEVRGWRTVLARLIRAGIIGKTAAENEFQVNKGRDSANWQTLVN